MFEPLVNPIFYLVFRFNREARHSQQLPVDFERETGTTGISTVYKFPGNKTAKDYDLWAGIFCGWHNGNGKRQINFLQKEFAKLVELNPSLEILQPEEKPSLIRAAIFGAATFLNPDDINFFIELQKRTKCSYVGALSHTVPEYEDLVSNIEGRTKLELQWVASPPTLINIYKQIKDRPADLQKPEHRFAPAMKGREITPAQIEAARTFIKIPSLT